ncbi:hypothetical protein [Nostoc sp.]|uniref:hypothetical protein n=1 Tax=Nostoc sp. TaxID=1180 RepID=UPI002FF9E1D2
MSKIWNWAKGLGIVIGGAIIFSGNSTIAQINQGGNLPNNFGSTTQNKIKIIQYAKCKNAPYIQNIISRVTDQNYSVSRDNILKFNYSIYPSQIQDRDAVGNQQVNELFLSIPGQIHTLLSQSSCWCPCRGVCPCSSSC